MFTSQYGRYFCGRWWLCYLSNKYSVSTHLVYSLHLYLVDTIYFLKRGKNIQELYYKTIVICGLTKWHSHFVLLYSISCIGGKIFAEEFGFQIIGTFFMCIFGTNWYIKVLTFSLFLNLFRKTSSLLRLSFSSSLLRKKLTYVMFSSQLSFLTHTRTHTHTWVSARPW